MHRSVFMMLALAGILFSGCSYEKIEVSDYPDDVGYQAHDIEISYNRFFEERVLDIYSEPESEGYREHRGERYTEQSAVGWYKIIIDHQEEIIFIHLYENTTGKDRKIIGKMTSHDGMFYSTAEISITQRAKPLI